MSCTVHRQLKPAAADAKPVDWGWDSLQTCCCDAHCHRQPVKTQICTIQLYHTMPATQNHATQQASIDPSSWGRQPCMQQLSCDA